MLTRRNLAIAVIALWVIGLALFARKQFVRSSRERLVEAAVRISPAAYFYAVERQGEAIGAAMSSVDTTTDRIITADMFTGRYPVGKDTLGVIARANSEYSRSLTLKDFAFQLEGDVSPVTLLGRAYGDTMLVLETDEPNEPERFKRTRLAGPLFTPTMAPIVGMLSKDRSAGDTIHVTIFDPLARALKDIVIQVQSDTVFEIADSAALDPATNTWRASWVNPVRARKLGGPSSPLTVWVDDDGRIVAATEAGGMRMIRTAYELAFRRARPGEKARTRTRRR